ncbi:MAG: hypothetical protein JXR41_14370, partial [Bacteroidales bacterium]|nr:hypothetical protein [Bacteroidales bacterium]MBN2764275.1 hypothetical protein [Bacteroidales bacterium]
ILVAEDPDQETGHSFAFALGEGINAVDNDTFLIRSDSLFILTSPDYETRQEYHICIRATDDDSKTFDKALVVYVNNLEESEPTVLTVHDVMKSTIKVYPNPVSDYFMLEYTSAETEILAARLFDLQGHFVQLFFTHKILQPGCHVLYLALDNGIPAGQFMLIVNNNSGTQCIPVIKY